MDAVTGGKMVNEQGKTMGCRLGMHQCAAMFRGGRTCHGQHSGRDCRDLKRHWKPDAGAVDEHQVGARTELPGKASASSPVPAERTPVDSRQSKTVHFESDHVLSQS